MAMGRPKAELMLNEAEQAQLHRWRVSRSMPAALRSARNMVLACAAGEPNSAVAVALRLTNATVGKWRRRFIEHRICRPVRRAAPGQPRTIDDERVAELINTTLHTQAKDGATHWSVRTAGGRDRHLQDQRAALSCNSLALQPHRTESFKLSTDPFFIEKLRDVVGLYLNPPEMRW